ncbi:hypothetical protein MNV49_005705 [Pseudohyphozyma bogoriensis]|nr:hypothetical protein MNV49_005705 [Pseudohyphozyma bogoriensis]
MSDSMLMDSPPSSTQRDPDVDELVGSGVGGATTAALLASSSLPFSLGVNSKGQSVIISAPSFLSHTTPPSPTATLTTTPPSSQETAGAQASATTNVLSYEQLVAIKEKLDIEKDGMDWMSTLDSAETALRELRSQVKDLPEFYAQREKLQKERWMLENEQLERQAKALSKKLAVVGRKARGVGAGEGGDGWHEGGRETELEGENRRLKADVKHYKRRLQEAESQSSRMEQELRRLRAHLLNGTPLVATDAEILLPSSSSSLPPSTSTTTKKKRSPLMGDAEAEHLLLAGKKLSHVRRINRIPLSQAIVNQAEEIVASASTSMATETNGSHVEKREVTPVIEEQPHETTRERERHKRKASTSSTAPTKLPASPHHSANTPTTPKRSTDSSHAALGASPSLFGDLLQAAQTVLVPTSSKPSKRRRLSFSDPHAPAAAASHPPHPPSTNPSYPTPAPAREERESDFFSALEVLADQAASASQEARPVSPIRKPAGGATSSRLGVGVGVGVGTGGGELPQLQFGGVLPGAEGGVRGGGPGGAANPVVTSVAERAKRERSPYVKWNLSEDELLVNAVLKHGQRWDQVASCVPTRSYHQCRQRWLRGLRSGDALPDELAHFEKAVKKAVEDYEASRDKKIPCSKCVRRGVPHLCRVEIPKAPLSDIPAESDRENLKIMALEELRRLRQNNQDTATRIVRLEALFSKAFSSEVDDSLPNITPNHIEATPAASTSKLPSFEPARPSPITSPAIALQQLPTPEPAATPIATDLEVDATQALEYMALGRQQGLVYPEPEQPFPHSSLTSSPISLYPTLSSIAAVAPNRTVSDILITYCLGSLSWHLSVLHVPTFMTEYVTFWSKGPAAFSSTSPSWLALYFSLLTVSAWMLTSEQRMLLGFSQAQCIELSRKWAPCATACLYRSDFLERHSLHSLQTILILCHGGRDIWSTNLIASLRCAGLSIAMEINLHRMVSNEAWEKLVAGADPAVRIKGLIHRETCKRVFWSLCREDWYSINWRQTFTLRPSQISTPLPLNAHDHDLSSGISIDRPLSEYTIASWSLGKIRLAQFVQHAFQHTNASPEESYSVILAVDAEFDRFMNDLPAWWRGGPPMPNMPATAFVIAAYHKLLALHRPFMKREGPAYQVSRTRAVQAVRRILMEAPLVGECRFWTVVYQISVACFISLQDLFAQPTPWTAQKEEQRLEIVNALPILQAAMKDGSGIAKRGYELASRMLEDQSRTRQLGNGIGPGSVATHSTPGSDLYPAQGARSGRETWGDSSTYQTDLFELEGEGFGTTFGLGDPWMAGIESFGELHPGEDFWPGGDSLGMHME